MFVFWSAIAIAVVTIASSFAALSRYKATTSWDIALVIAPFAVWWLLALLNLRPKSLSNLIELYALIPLLAFVLAIRTFFGTNKPQKTRAHIAFASSLAIAVLLYVFVPALPE